jgi:hypothetical protein
MAVAAHGGSWFPGWGELRVANGAELGHLDPVDIGDGNDLEVVAVALDVLGAVAG